MNETAERTRSRSGAGLAALAVAAACAAAAAVAWAGGQGGTAALGVPVVGWCALLAFTTQWLAFGAAYALQTERFYDLTGSVTYVGVALVALVLTGAYDLRSWLLVAMVFVWAARLGSFLFRRVRREGGDGRFDRIKPSASRFLVAWTLQGLWVFLTLAAALAAMTAATGAPLGALDVVGLVVWSAGLAVEWIADAQKSAFRRDPANRDRFITTGLWSWSRHPNYFGEIVLWIGVALVATPTLAGWRWLTWISPLFVILLLTRVSGVPLLEKRAQRRWGDDGRYQAYRTRTPLLVPWPPRA